MVRDKFVHPNVCKFSQLCGNIYSFASNESLSNLAILLILRRSFQWCRRISPSWSMSNVEKTMEGSIPNLCFFYFLKVLLLSRACSITAVRKCLIFLIICLCSLLKIQRRDGQPSRWRWELLCKVRGSWKPFLWFVKTSIKCRLKWDGPISDIIFLNL